MLNTFAKDGARHGKQLSVWDQCEFHWRAIMNTVKSETVLRPAVATPIARVVRGEMARAPSADSERTAEPINEPSVSFLQRIGGAPIAEVDALIKELQAERNYLQSEGERLQRELLQYAQLSDAA